MVDAIASSQGTLRPMGKTHWGVLKLYNLLGRWIAYSRPAVFKSNFLELFFRCRVHCETARSAELLFNGNYLLAELS